jgi:ribose 5-phosphate isomerase B
MAMPDIVFIAADHRGFPLKARLVAWLKEHGFTPKDLGAHSEERCDSIDYAIKMAAELATHPEQRGILICGTGNGIAMAANRYRSIRAALCFTADMARLAREHNDANVLALGANVISEQVALDCVDVFLKTKFLGGKYAERRDKLTKLGGL